ncbi:MAG: hypothetical protein AAGB22_14655, partial [Bacteroidota bacterium]
GVTRIAGSKVFVYFEGDYAKLEQQIRAGVAQIVLGQMMFGENWKEMIKNSALLNLPDWYVNGLISYAAQPWSVYIDDRVRDGVLLGKYDKFNRLSGTDAANAGHSLWYYIAETYGENVIPNIIYMARVSRNVESGFLFVLGVSLRTLMDESLAYYRKRYQLDDTLHQDPEGTMLKTRTKKTRDYYHFQLSSNGTHAAWVSNEKGQIKVWVYDYKKKRRKCIMREGHKLDRINDHTYPILAWHPDGERLAIVKEKRGEIHMHFHSLDRKEKLDPRPIFNIEKVLDISFSGDGKQVVMSAMNKGKSDIYIYTLASNAQKQITNDLYDDLNPRFIDRSSEIIFSSNRPGDTLVKDNEPDLRTLLPTKDLFIYDVTTGSPV